MIESAPLLSNKLSNHNSNRQLEAYRKGKRWDWILRPYLLVLLLTLGGVGFSANSSQATPNVVLWDTAVALSKPIAIERTSWKFVPADLLSLEADPPKASSDPGYYGRSYAFKGDAVVENQYLCTVISSAEGKLLIYAKPQPSSSGGDGPRVSTNFVKTLELGPLPNSNPQTSLSRVEILQNAADEVVLQVFYSAPSGQDSSWLVTVGKSDIVEIHPGPGMKGITMASVLAHGIVPGLIGDDLILSPADYPEANTLYVPAESFFLGLVEGENSQWAMTWPKGGQHLKLQQSNEPGVGRTTKSIDFESDGKSLYLAPMSAPGIWHQEKLGPTHLEKDMKMSWRKPFAARWKTQLYEGEVRTSFAFKQAKGQIWRGVPGSYSYPVWFDGDDAYCHLSKKVPPKGVALIYFLEGQDTPSLISTPVDIVKATLGWSVSEEILDTAGRNLRPHHRRGAEGVRRACTCGCTEAIQAVFETGEEVTRKDYINEAVDDMKYFVQCHVRRIDEYRSFANDLIQYLEAQGRATAALKPYIEKLEQTARQIQQEYSIQKENMKTLAYADELGRKTLELTGKKEPNNLKAYMELLKAWREMGGAQDYVLAQCHTITRKLCQEAGYGAVVQPEAAPVATEVRARCRKCLRNPDGYEIWANY